LRRLAVAGGQYLFVALVLVQVYLAGAFLMWEGDAYSAHQGLGWLMMNLSYLTLLIAAVARMPRQFWPEFTAFFVLLHVQPFLPLIAPDEGLGWVRALHPLNAFFILALAFRTARMAQALALNPTNGASE